MAYAPGLGYREYLDGPMDEPLNIKAFPIEPPRLPSWLMTPEAPEPKPSAEGKALLFQQFEMVYPRVLERIYSGYTLTKAIKELPIEIDSGAFMRWLKKDPQRFELYKEAKEIRTEAWAGKIIEHAEGEYTGGADCSELVQRSKLIVDTYKWLMGADNRRTYGDTKSIELNSTISITAALAQAQSRVLIDAVDADVVEDVKLLTDGEDED